MGTYSWPRSFLNQHLKKPWGASISPNFSSMWVGWLPCSWSPSLAGCSNPMVQKIHQSTLPDKCHVDCKPILPLRKMTGTQYQLSTLCACGSQCLCGVVASPFRSLRLIRSTSSIYSRSIPSHPSPITNSTVSLLCSPLSYSSHWYARRSFSMLLSTAIHNTKSPQSLANASSSMSCLRLLTTYTETLGGPWSKRADRSGSHPSAW